MAPALPLASNPVSITVPGTTSDFVWFAAPGQSQYFASIELLTGNPGSTVRLPFVPNSMVMDQGGNSLYFGSARELMVYSTASNSLTEQNTSSPGVVLAVSPNNSELVINDQVRGLFYLYNTSSGPSSSYGGMGVAAAWTPDSNTLYIVDNAQANSPVSCTNPLITGHTNTLYVYNVNVGWSTYPLPPNPLPARRIADLHHAAGCAHLDQRASPGHHRPRHWRISCRHSNRRPHLVPLRHGRQQRQHSVLSPE